MLTAAESDVVALSGSLCIASPAELTISKGLSRFRCLARCLLARAKQFNMKEDDLIGRRTCSYTLQLQGLQVCRFMACRDSQACQCLTRSRSRNSTVVKRKNRQAHRFVASIHRLASSQVHSQANVIRFASEKLIACRFSFVHNMDQASTGAQIPSPAILRLRESHWL